MKYNIITTVLFTLLFLNTPCIADTKKDFSLHGIKLGIDEETLTEDYPEFNCEADSSNLELRHCKAKFDPTSQSGVFEKLRGSSIDILVIFRKNKLININIPFYKVFFETSAQFFIEQYGQPKIIEKVIKNKHGKEQNNRTLLWIQGDESIIYWEVDEDRFSNENNDEYSKILFLLKE